MTAWNFAVVNSFGLASATRVVQFTSLSEKDEEFTLLMLVLVFWPLFCSPFPDSGSNLCLSTTGYDTLFFRPMLLGHLMTVKSSLASRVLLWPRLVLDSCAQGTLPS